MDQPAGTPREPTAKQDDFLLADWLVQPGLTRMSRAGQSVHVRAKIMDLLVYFAQRPDAVLSKDALLDGVWGTTDISESALTRSITELRHALGDDADRPSMIETISKRGYRLIAPVTAVPDPTASANLVEPAAAAVPVRPSRRAAVSIGGAVLLLAGGAGWIAFGRPDGAHRSGSPAAVSVRRSVAVLGFRNVTQRSDAAWLSTAFSQMLATELAADGSLRTVPGETVDRVRTDLALGDVDSFARGTLTRIRQNLGADFMVLGSYVVLGDGPDRKVRLDLRTQNAVTGETLVTLSETGTEADLLELVSRTGTRLRAGFGIGAVSADVTAAMRASQPSNAIAARYYAEGLTRLRRWDAAEARDLLLKAIAVEPGYAPAHAALSFTWLLLGDRGEEIAEARRAMELSAGLSREERLVIEGRYRETHGQREQSLEIYRTLVGFFPDNLEYGLGLAGRQVSANKWGDALATLDRLRALPLPASADPRIDLAEAQAARLSSDLDRAQKAGARAVDTAAAQGARLLLAQAKLEQSFLSRHRGESARAMALLQEAGAIFDAIGNRRGAIAVRQGRANALRATGDFAGARKMYEEVADGFRELGSTSAQALALSDLAVMLASQGHLVEAALLREQTLRITREGGHKEQLAGALVWMGHLQFLLGESGAATKAFEEALRLSREVGRKTVTATVLQGWAEFRATQAPPAEAKKLAEEALAGQRAAASVSGPASMVSALMTVASTLLAEGDLGGAKRVLEEAAALPLRPGPGIDRATAAGNALVRAEVAFEEGRVQDSLTEARRAAELFRAEGLADEEAFAEAAVGRALLAAKQSHEALQAVGRASAHAQTSDNRLLRLSVVIASTRVGAATQAPVAIADASKSLESVRLEAAKYGFATLGLEARLALGEIEVHAGSVTAGRARLSALEREARARGFGLIARKAAAARRQG
jgi:DNA-binding winged helix-turn-helix (wHTH) protein/tetratricopeptide (TPR) repeat protein/TolB-like protein